jgi:molybdenum cofactor guanylyltransferase
MTAIVNNYPINPTDPMHPSSDNVPNLIGVVLCGGQSTRMGTDKGLLEHQSATCAQLAIDKLLTLKIPVVLSVNEQQFNVYKSHFTKTPLVPDNAELNIGGPLKGILSVHLQPSSQDLLVLACDMINMNVKILEELKRSYNKQYEAFVFKCEDAVEPLCGIYTSAGLKKVYDLYVQGQLKRHSMMYVLENLNTQYLALSQEEKLYFNNYNSPSDLRSM